MMPLARMQQPPVAVSTTTSTTDATLKSVSELISAAAAASNSLTSNRLQLTGSTSPPSIMSASSSSSSSSSTSSSPKSVPSSMASVSSPPSSSVSPDVVASSTSPVTHQASSSVSPPHTSQHAAMAAAAAAVCTSSAQILSAEMINPLRELNNYLARIEEEKCSLREENEKLNDVREKLNMDLVTYSRFNCILECMKRSLKNALGAIECIDQNKACRCNEHLNVNLRQIVQESKIEISLWQQKYESLVYKFHTEYENFHRMGSILSIDENPLRHMNAALMGHNGALLSIPEVPERNGFREPTPVTSASTPNGNSEKLTNGSATDLSSSNGNRAQTPANNASPALTNGYSAHKPANGEAPPPGPSEKGSVLKTSLDLATTINFSPASFLTNDANNNTAKPANRGKDDEECHTPPPLIPAPPPPTSAPNNNSSSTPVTSAQELISIDLAKRINSGDMSGFWRLNKYPASPTSPPPQATTVQQVKNTNGFSTPDIELKAEMRSLSRLGDQLEEKQLANSPTILDGAHPLKKEPKAEHPSNEDEKVKVEKFKCDWPDCNQVLDSDEILTQHRRCHIRKSNYQCRYCSARMLSREDLEDHEVRCEKSERKLSKIHSSPEPEIIISKRKREILEREESLSSIGSGGSRSCSPKMVIDERQRKVDSGHSSEEEIEVEEIASRVARPEPTTTDRLFLSQLSKDRESPKNSLSTFDSFDARQREAAEALDLVRYSELFHPNKRQKAFTISTPSPYNLSSQHLASSALSAFYPALSSNAGGNTGLPHSLLGPAPGAPAPSGTAATMDLAALVESGRISPLTLSMLAQQRENQQRFQHYFAAAAAQHHLSQQTATPAVSAPSPIQPPPSAQSPGTVENLSARSSSFSSATSPFYHQRTSSVSGLMAPPSGASSSSSKPALSPVSQASTERERASSPCLSFGPHSATSPLFSPPAGRSYTISTPNSFSALAALAAAATSSAANNNAAAAAAAAAAAVNGLPKPPPQNVSLTSSDLQSQKSSFLSGFDFRSNGLGPSPMSSPPGAGVLKATQLGGYNPYGQPPTGRSIGIPPHQPTVITPSPVELLSGSRAQTSLMMAAAAAAAAEGRPCLPGHGVSPASEASRITAAALASLGALKHHQSTGTPMGEYKRTRYSGIGRYRCPWPDCGYTPHFLRDLRRHMFKHTGDKKHKCDYPGCDFVSVWKTSLLQHQRKKHYGVSSSIPLRTNNHHSSAGAENRPARNENGTVLAGAI